MIGVVIGSRADQLESDIAPQPFIARAKNLAHGSGANFFEHSVVTYDLASHGWGDLAGMLGCIFSAVNHLIRPALLPNARACPGSLDCLFSGIIRSAESRRAIIPVRLQTFEAACDLSTGESRVNQVR